MVYGDAEDPELWTGLPLDRVKGILLTLPEFDARCLATLQLRKRGYRGQIGTISYFPEMNPVMNPIRRNQYNPNCNCATSDIISRDQGGSSTTSTVTWSTPGRARMHFSTSL